MAHPLVKDDVKDQDDLRRGKASFLKRFGLDSALLLPDILIPQAQVCWKTSGLRATLDVAAAWAKITHGPLLDFPGGWAVQDQEHICAMKTAPLFEVACALGLRTAEPDWLLNLGKQYGYNQEMAFQVYDNYCDPIQVIGQPWEAAARGDLPSSLRWLRTRVRGDGVVTDENDTDVLDIGRRYLDAASSVTGPFHESVGKAHVRELPQFCCDSLIAEIGEAS